jgi:hypothetical protein
MELARSSKQSQVKMDRGAPCPVCSSMSHSSMDCSQLTGGLREGFYAPPSGYRDEGDEEDDSLSSVLKGFLLGLGLW